jgi:hypothetical protein
MSLSTRVALAVLLLATLFARAQDIPASQASKHLNEIETVCGTVAGKNTATASAGTPTFIDFEKPFPNQTFTAVIWQRDKAAVGSFPSAGAVCVTGLVTQYHGRPQIVLRSRSDWRISPPKLSNDNRYTDSDGQSVHSPAYSSGGVPAGATARCGDGTYSFSQHRQGTCSHHGGVAQWLQ